MPTYEYICGKCGHQFDVHQAITARPLKVCPEESCGLKKWGRGAVKRAISGGSGLLFKGSGFYITDYRSAGYQQAAKKESHTGSKTSPPAPGPAAKAESKPAKPSSKT